MGDFPNKIVKGGNYGLLSPFSNTPLADGMAIANAATTNTATTWTANRAIYLPICVNRPITVLDFQIIVTTQNGNVDAGIYNWNGTKIVSNGGVACGAAGLQTIAVADTLLNPGWYHIAFASSSSTAVFRASNASTVLVRACGGQQESSAYPLPSTATFAAYATGIFPMIVASFKSVF